MSVEPGTQEGTDLRNSTERRDELARNLDRVKAEIEAIADRAGRQAPQLLPVTKFHPAEDIALLAQLGVTDVAENREQEARMKAEQLPDVRFHMIGQVQTKKANHVARWAASVHSVDSEKLAAALDKGIVLAIDRGQRSEDTVLPVYIQVSADGDTSRGGVEVEQLAQLAEFVESTAYLRLEGLMVVPPLNSNPREVFTHVRQLVDDLAARFERELLLSAGMSSDLEDAIFCGSDVVRVGTSIMGPRPVA